MTLRTRRACRKDSTLPQFDGTGPLGKGPMSGRGMGFCAMEVPDGNTPAFGRDLAGRDGQETETSEKTGKEVIAMPRGDGTGPGGMGPMTGRAAGYCAGYPVPGYMNSMPGQGFAGPGLPGAYGPAPYAYGAAPYAYGAGYAGFGARSFGGFGRGYGRGRGAGFGRGRGRGRR